MGIVFFDVSMSIDGFIAGPNGGPKLPLGEGGAALHAWAEPSDELVAEAIARTGASVIGKRTFDEVEANGREDAPFPPSVFVLTHAQREPWIRPGRTTFHFVNDGIESALAQAKKTAGDKDVRIGGGADVIRQYVKASLVGEMCLHFVPTTLGKGIRLFEGIDRSKMNARLLGTIPSEKVTHVTYALGT